jgi:hypothetical protein
MGGYEVKMASKTLRLLAPASALSADEAVDAGSSRAAPSQNRSCGS